MQQVLRKLFDETLAAVSIDAAFARRADELAERIAPRALVIAFGKAARSMAAALRTHLPHHTLRGLVVPPEPDDAPLPPFEMVVGGHPLPSEGSLRAGRRALELATSARADEQLLFLISGGGSSLLELPIDPAVTIEQLRALYQALVGCGAGIDEINAVRGSLSAVKNGRLALAGQSARSQLSVLVSDVPAGSLALASNPTGVGTQDARACRRVLDTYQLWNAVPLPLRERLRREDLPPTMHAQHELVGRCDTLRLLDEQDARRHARDAARALGWHVDDRIEVDEWPVERAADHLLDHLRELHRQHVGQAVAIVTTGELAIELADHPGLGGRNQQFALACAARIAGEPITVMSCGTDGIDGNSRAAGAIVDGTTDARARQRGLDVAQHLARFDAFSLLDTLDDTVITGPTGHNVRDLRVLVHQA